MYILTSYGTLKYDYVVKTIQMFNFQPLTNISVTTGLSFLLSMTSAIISSKTTTLYVFFLDYILQYFYNYLAYRLNFINILLIAYQT